MSRIADSAGLAVEVRDEGALEARLLRSMVVAVVIAVIASVIFAPWRVSTGLVLGGALSLLNYHWLHSSVVAIFDIDLTAERPRAKASRYLLRYVVVAAVVFAAYNLNLVSLTATIAGLCSFVPALFVEAAREFYFAIIHREESF